MTVKAFSTLLLALACAATALAQTAMPPGIRRIPGRSALQAPAIVPTNETPSEVRQLPVRSSSLSRSSSASAQSTSRYMAPTTKSDDLVESPATNVIKGAFGYTLGAIWDGPIPDGAKAVVGKSRTPGVGRDPVFEPPFGRIGEVSLPVKASLPFPPFETVTLSVSTNDLRIAAIAAETPRMMLAESYTKSMEKVDKIAKMTAGELGIVGFEHSVVTNWNALQLSGYHTSPVIAGKLYREFVKSHPDDPDYATFKKVAIKGVLEYRAHIVAGSRYNGRRAIGDRVVSGTPDYLQTIEQPFELSADYYPYAGDTVFRFCVRDVEDHTEHTNLISVADLKKRAEEEAKKRAEEAEKKAALRTATMRPGIVRLQANRTEQQPQTEEEKAKNEVVNKVEQDFKNSLYRLSFVEAVEKAKDNVPEALLRIALAYAEGKEIKENRNKAREYIEKACGLKYGYAQYVYGLAFADSWLRDVKCTKYGLDYWAIRSMGGWEADFPKAVRLFSQAVSNGVSFVQADLEYARGKLKAAEEEEARKNKNAELLKSAMADKQEREAAEAAKKAAEAEAAKKAAEAEAAKKAAEAEATKKAAEAEAAKKAAEAEAAKKAAEAEAAKKAAEAEAAKKAVEAEKKAARERTLAEMKDSMRRLSFEEAATKAKENDPAALVRIALAFAEGKELSKNLVESEKRLSAAGEKGYGVAQYVQGLVAGANMSGKKGNGFFAEKNARWRTRLSEIGWATRVVNRPDFSPSESTSQWFFKRGVTEKQRLERENALAEKAVDCFENAMSNGVSIAQEDLEVMRRELSEVSKELNNLLAAEALAKEKKAESDAIKKRNEALLNGVPLDQSRKNEEDAFENDENTRMEALKKDEQDFKDKQDFKNSLYRLSFAEAAEKARDNDPEALLRIALAYVDGKDVDEDGNKAREYIEKACGLSYGYAQYVYGLAQTSEDRSRFNNRCHEFGISTSIRHLLPVQKELVKPESHLFQSVAQIKPIKPGSRVFKLVAKGNMSQAARFFEQALSNGVSFAQADLEYARGKLKAAEEEEARKKSNTELLKGETE